MRSGKMFNATHIQPTLKREACMHAKETYMLGKVGVAKAIFRRLFRRSKHHPRRYIPRDPIDRWIMRGAAMRVNGTIIRAPTEERYGILHACKNYVCMHTMNGL